MFRKILLLFSLLKLSSVYAINNVNNINTYELHKKLDTLYFNDFDKALLFAKTILSEKKLPEEEEGYFNIVIGEIYYQQLMPDSSLKYIYKAQHVFKKNNNVLNYYKAKINEAKAEELKNNFLKFYSIISSVLADNKKTLQDTSITINCYMELAILHNNLYDTINRNHYYKLSYNFAEKIFTKGRIRDSISLINYYLHYAIYNMDVLKNEKMAELCIEKSKKIMKNFPSNKLFYLKLMDAQFHYYYNGNNFYEAKKCLDNIASFMPMGFYRLSKPFSLAKICYEENSIQESINNMKEAEAVYFENKFDEELLLLQIYKWLSFLYNENKNYPKASEYYAKYVRINNKFFNASQINIINTLRFQRAEKEHEYDVKVLKQENELKDKQAKIATLTRNIILFISTIIILIIFLLFNRYRVYQKFTQAELEKSKLKAENLQSILVLNQEKLDYFTNQIREKSELIDTLQEQLLKLNTTEKENQGISELLKTAHEYINSNKYWEEFIATFNLVHTNFFQKLIVDFPNLTKAEQRLCALIKCNLGNKEIANVLNINTDTVKRTCNRLGKKMNLEEEENLRQFILKRT